MNVDRSILEDYLSKKFFNILINKSEELEIYNYAYEKYNYPKGIFSDFLSSRKSIEEANDYYFPTLTGMYLKISRTLITIATVFFTPLYLLYMQNPQWLPGVFSFVMVRDQINLPLIWQFLLLELSIDGLRLAAMNTPTMLSTPLSVIAGIVMGEFSVESGWFNSEVMLYMAFVAVANYTQPNFELGYALKFMRLMLLVLTAVFNLYGFVAGCVLVLCFLVFNKTLSGRNYLNVKLN